MNKYVPTGILVNVAKSRTVFDASAVPGVNGMVFVYPNCPAVGTTPAIGNVVFI